MRSGTEAGDALAAAVALTFGLLLTVAGALHSISVAPIPLLNDDPYDTRRAWLLTIGLIVVYSGVVNTMLYRRVRRRERWALGMAATATTLLLAFLVIVHPAANQIVLILMSGGYLTLLLWRLRAGARTVTDDAEGVD